MVGVTTATIPEDWGTCQSQEIPGGCTCLNPEGTQHEAGFLS